MEKQARRSSWGRRCAVALTLVVGLAVAQHAHGVSGTTAHGDWVQVASRPDVQCRIGPARGGNGGGSGTGGDGGTGGAGTGGAADAAGTGGAGGAGGAGGSGGGTGGNGGNGGTGAIANGGNGAGGSADGGNGTGGNGRGGNGILRGSCGRSGDRCPGGTYDDGLDPYCDGAPYGPAGSPSGPFGGWR